ncbi:hypothetical protein BKH41_01830 [Helicobacter sp. 12S02232-10]|nr:hypothetical protein BKH41_01830 [Helicobacter sp. 12S02232-10]
MTSLERELFELIKDYADFKSKTYSKHNVRDLDSFQILQNQINNTQSMQELNGICQRLCYFGVKSIANLKILNHFYNFLKENSKALKIKELKLLKESVVIDFLYNLSLRYKDSSIFVFKTNIGTFFKYLDKNRGYRFNFSLKMSLGKQVKIPKFLPKEKFFDFINYLKNASFHTDLDKRNRLIVLIVAYSGLRSSEVRGLKTTDITGDEQNYYFKVNGKGNKERIAIIRKELIEEFLQEWLNTPTRKRKNSKGYIFMTAKNTNTTSYFLNKILKKLGFLQDINVGLHMLRHSFGSYIYGETKDLILTQNALGHSNIETTKIYIHTNNDYCRQVANLF